jgi:hypothetical protein
MIVRVNPAALKQNKWHEYAVRFLFGGVVTSIAGIIAEKYGPGVGGLFLAFPAIFPASATLIEKHERQRKEKHGVKAANRGRNAAAVDAAGAALGSIGLMFFGAMVWWLAPLLSAGKMLLLATVVWAGVSILAWLIRKWLPD